MKKFPLFLLPFLLVGCQGIESSSNLSSENDSTGTSESSSTVITPYAYVKDVSATSPILIAGQLEGVTIDYVVTSQPVLFAASQKNGNLSIYANIAAEFGEKYSTDGFPQAGLFIKKSLAEDTSKKEDIETFLSTFDTDIEDLISGGTNAVSYMNAYSTDTTVQQSRFGFAAGVISNVQKDNGLAIIGTDKQPSIEDFAKFKEPLGIDIQEENLSTYYSDYPTKEASDSLSFSVITPKGAPSAAFARYASDTDHFTAASPSDVQAAFQKKEADFIVFDSVNGLKLSAANDSAYLLVRMVTFGNLYLVSTGNDTNSTLDSTDKVVSYGEGLVPDLVYKSVYSA